jgi:cytochrome c
MKAAGWLLLALVGSVLLARVHPFGDAGLYRSGPPVLSAALPSDVRETLTIKCGDCHSDGTRAPVYGRFAPASWLMERDIVEARKAMNLAHWDSYTRDQQQAFAAKMVTETRAKKMPLAQYRVIHWGSSMSDAEVQMLAKWLHGMTSGTPEATADVGDAARGKDVFERRCTGCHSLTQNREGPRLAGVFGRAAGTAPGFGYSAAMKSAHFTWDDAQFERWLTDPDAVVKGTDMDFRVAKAQERSDLIAYLRTVK